LTIGIAQPDLCARGIFARPQQLPSISRSETIARLVIMEAPLTIRPPPSSRMTAVTRPHFLPMLGCRVWRQLKIPSTLSPSASLFQEPWF